MAGPYWMDSDVFIQSKNGPYGLDFAPGFWRWLEWCITDGHVRSPMLVYKELTAYKDDLADWARERETEGLLFVESTKSVQDIYRAIADHVKAKYIPAQHVPFLAGADGWVIAHAQESSGVVVAHEATVDVKSQKVKIPNVCAHFKVPCMKLQDMRKAIGGLKLFNKP
jgi:hypothetical protein